MSTWTTTPAGFADHDVTAAVMRPLESWQRRAACRGLSRLFDPPTAITAAEMRKREREALDVCTACPVRVACWAWVMDLPEYLDPGGVCGGMTLVARTKARRKQAPAKQPTAVTTVAKQCRICQRLKQPAEFYRNGDSPDGLRNECTGCYRGGKKKQGVA